MNMKKTRFILWVVVAAMVLMGAGYAAWSQTFTINSTVQTGHLYVKVQKAIEDQSIGIDEGVNSTTVNFTITDMYPGKSVQHVLRFTNQGTMPVRLKFNSGTYPENDPLWRDLVIEVNGEEVKSAGDTDIEDVGNKIAEILTNPVLAVGITRDITITQTLDISSTDETESSLINWSLGFVFEQYNAPVINP